MGRIGKGQIGLLIAADDRGEFGTESGEDLRWLMANGGENWRKYIPSLRKEAMFGVRRITVNPTELACMEPTVTYNPLSTTYDQSLGLRALIERAVGSNNLGNINSDITQERFPLKGIGVRMVKTRVEPYLHNETRQQAAQRLVVAGHILGNTGDLAGFLHDHPDEVEKWGWVDAISEDSRWTDSDGDVCVPVASVSAAYRNFRLGSFRIPQYSDRGVLVLCE